MANPYRIPLLFALIAAGLAGNHFHYPIFLNIDFLFGSIFAMLALQLFGLGLGIPVAAAIASYTYLLWNHPFAMVIMTAEVAVVGLLMQRRQIGMVLADTLYWLFIGMPLVFIFYSLVMQVSIDTAWITMTKQAVNGIANALVARMLYTGYALRSRCAMIAFKDIIYNLLAFFVLAPALIMLATASRSDFLAMDREIRTALGKDGIHIGQLLETWLGNRKLAVTHLAEMAASRSSQEMQASLELIKKSTPTFLRIGLLNKEATITAYYPLRDELGQENIGKNFADRPFIPQLKQTGKPMLSEVVMGRIGTPKPMVTMLAPVLLHGEYNGYISGILSLEQAQEIFEKHLEGRGTLYSLIDKNGNVIMSNRSDQQVMTPFVRGQGTMNRLDPKISQWVPFVASNISIAERWKKSFYVLETNLGELSEWKLILEQPVAPFQKKLFDTYSTHLIRLFLILLGALALAEILSRRSTNTFEKLRLATHDLPVKLATGGGDVTWPAASVTEANHLLINFQQMADSLKTQFQEVRQINATLEQRIQERTAALKESNERLALAQKATQDAIWDWDLLANHLYYSPQWFAMIGYEEGELGADPCLWRRLMHPEDLEQANRIVEGAFAGRADSFEMEIRLLHKAGHYVPVLTRGFILRDANGRAIRTSGSNSDLTERKQTEEAQRLWERQQQKLQKVESLNCMAGAVAHHFNNQLAVVIGSLEIAIDELPLDEVHSKQLTGAMRAAHKAAEISHKMLTYLGQVTGPREQVDLSSLCRQYIPLLQATAPQDLLLRTDLPSHGPIIHANADQIQQVVAILVTNAWEAHGEQQHPIELTVKTVTPADTCVAHRFPIGWQTKNVAYCCLEVKDSGCGIADEDIDKLFDPFFSSKFTGRGLGLPMVLGIVKSHLGAIAVETAIGKGSNFRVFLPIAAEQAESLIP